MVCKERKREELQAQVAITNVGSRRLGSPLMSIIGEEKTMWEELEEGFYQDFQFIDGSSIFVWTLIPCHYFILT